MLVVGHIPGARRARPSIRKMNATKITRDSKSNLALAFISLGRERRLDITTFYAFCRVIDDIVDAGDATVETKQQQLNDWRAWLRHSQPNEPQLAPDIRRLIGKYPLSPDMFDQIITGVEMDLYKSSYANFEELRVYCYHVASAVGLVSIEIFGYQNPACREYAIELGLALQMTNIIRDVGKDLERGRIYLPKEDLDKFGYAESDLRQRVRNPAFVELMDFEASRAKGFFSRAAGILPAEDRRSMVAAEIMSSVYRSLLDRMEKDRFRVFEKEYRLNRAEKAARILGQILKCR
jgi:15-cis-phytoene synthase